MKRMAAMALMAGLLGTPVLAAEQARADEPVKLADQELDQVVAGDGSLLNLNLNLDVMLKNISVLVNVSNVPINAGVAVQANALGQAIQNATITVGQQVTQMQGIPMP
jgi:hypothetical protein